VREVQDRADGDEVLARGARAGAGGQARVAHRLDVRDGEVGNERVGAERRQQLGAHEHAVVADGRRLALAAVLDVVEPRVGGLGEGDRVHGGPGVQVELAQQLEHRVGGLVAGQQARGRG
jgi:hypothetical protein